MAGPPPTERKSLKSRQRVPRLHSGVASRVGALEKDEAEVEVRTKVEQVLSIMEGPDRAKDDRVRVPNEFKAVVRSRVMIPWLLSLIRLQRHNILLRYSIPCTFRCCGGDSTRKSRGPSRWNTRNTNIEEHFYDPNPTHTLPDAESMRLAAQVKESMARVSQMYCELVLRVGSCKRGIARTRQIRWRRKFGVQLSYEHDFPNQNMFETLYFFVCRVVMGCLQEYHPPRRLFTSPRVDQLITADLHRLFKSMSYNMHGRELKLKRLEEIESKRKRTFEETVEELRSAQSKAPVTPAPAEGEEAVLSKREQFRLKIVSPSVRELVEAAHERARLPRSHRKLVRDYGRSDKRVLDQSIHGSMFVDYNDLVPVPYRRSPLVSLLLPSPREAVLRMIDVDFSRGPNSARESRSRREVPDSGRMPQTARDSTELSLPPLGTGNGGQSKATVAPIKTERSDAAMSLPQEYHSHSLVRHTPRTRWFTHV